MVNRKTITMFLSIAFILLGIVLILPLEAEIYVGTRSGSFTLSINKGEVWNFRYVWLNINSTSLEEALSIFTMPYLQVFQHLFMGRRIYPYNA